MPELSASNCATFLPPDVRQTNIVHFLDPNRDQKPFRAEIIVTFIRHFGQTLDILPATCCVSNCDSDNTAPQVGLLQRYFAPRPPDFAGTGESASVDEADGDDASAGFSRRRPGNFRAGAFAVAGMVSRAWQPGHSISIPAPASSTTTRCVQCGHV